jgi:hypothetical protein
VQFLAIGQLTPGADIAPHFAAEQQRVAELRAEGVVEQFFLKADRSGSVFILSGDSQAAVQERIDTFPFVQHGLIRFDLIELAAPEG